MAFKAPCNCNAVAGLKAYFPDDKGVATSQVFLFTDAHGNNLTGVGHLFTTGAIVKVILYVDEGKAYIQNADTNAYLEGKFEGKADLVDGKVPVEQLPEISSVKTFEATIGTAWAENEDTGVKTQTVTIAGITAENTAKVDHSSASVDGTSDGYATFVEEENQYLTYITNGFAETVAGGIKFTIFGDVPTVSIPIVVEVV